MKAAKSKPIMEIDPSEYGYVKDKLGNPTLDIHTITRINAVEIARASKDLVTASRKT
jgi:hypothetical protein